MVQRLEARVAWKRQEQALWPWRLTSTKAESLTPRHWQWWTARPGLHSRLTKNRRVFWGISPTQGVEVDVQTPSNMEVKSFLIDIIRFWATTGITWTCIGKWTGKPLFVKALDLAVIDGCGRNAKKKITLASAPSAKTINPRRVTCAERGSSDPPAIGW